MVAAGAVESRPELRINLEEAGRDHDGTSAASAGQAVTKNASSAASNFFMFPPLGLSGSEVSRSMLPTLFRRGDARPFIHLYARDHCIRTAVRLKDRRLAFLDVKPIPAKSIDDVGLVRDDHHIAAG